MFINSHTQLLSILPVEAYGQLHNNFRGFYQLTRGYNWIALLIKLYASLCTKTAVPIVQIEVGMLVAHKCWRYSLLLRLACIYDINPLQHLSQVVTVHTCITNHTSSQCSWYSRSKFQSSPTQRSQLI